MSPPFPLPFQKFPPPPLPDGPEGVFPPRRDLLVSSPFPLFPVKDLPFFPQLTFFSTYNRPRGLFSFVNEQAPSKFFLSPTSTGLVPPIQDRVFFFLFFSPPPQRSDATILPFSFPRKEGSPFPPKGFSPFFLGRCAFFR